jgi:hypothetical protein
MPAPRGGENRDDEDAFSDDVTDDAAIFETETDVTCPHCGETMSLTLDPAGGVEQEYVEDCEVCCRPWRVRLSYDAAGVAHVELQAV